MGTIKIKKIRMAMIIVENFVVKRFATCKSNAKLQADCDLRTLNTGKSTNFAILPEKYF